MLWRLDKTAFLVYCIGMLEKRKLELVSERNRLLAIVNADEDINAVNASIDLELVDKELAMVIEAIEISSWGELPPPPKENCIVI